jgi:hypothetical protein
VSDLWRDEKRSPGPWPQGKRAPLAIVAVVVALVAFDQLHNRTVIGVFVVCIGLRAWRPRACGQQVMLTGGTTSVGVDRIGDVRVFG